MAKLIRLSALLRVSAAFVNHRPLILHHSLQLFATDGPINEDIFDISPPLRIEGNSLKTWAFPAGTQRSVQVSIKSLGRPIEASVELWQTPSYTPTKFTVECEDGSDNIVHSIIQLPEGHPVTVAAYNTEGQEFPMDATVVEMPDNGVESAFASFEGQRPQYIEGGKGVKSYTFGFGVESFEVLLTTKMRNMKGGCTAVLIFPFFAPVLISYAHLVYEKPTSKYCTDQTTIMRLLRWKPTMQLYIHIIQSYKRRMERIHCVS